jgi:acetyl-CoA carboxylase biotin carboxyl carrier protein
VNIDLKELECLLKLLEERQISEFLIEDEKSRLQIKRNSSSAMPAVGGNPLQAQVMASIPHQGPAQSAHQPAMPLEEPDLTFVTSPFVGTFYRAPSPEAPPFVDAGTQARKGQALCIVEAMKLMNEIEAEFACTIVECLVENARPVEFGQKLFKVRKAK